MQLRRLPSPAALPQWRTARLARPSPHRHHTRSPFRRASRNPPPLSRPSMPLRRSPSPAALPQWRTVRLAQPSPQRHHIRSLSRRPPPLSRALQFIRQPPQFTHPSYHLWRLNLPHLCIQPLQLKLPPPEFPLLLQWQHQVQLSTPVPPLSDQAPPQLRTTAPPLSNRVPLQLCTPARPLSDQAPLQLSTPALPLSDPARPQLCTPAPPLSEQAPFQLCTPAFPLLGQAPLQLCTPALPLSEQVPFQLYTPVFPLSEQARSYPAFQLFPRAHRLCLSRVPVEPWPSALQSSPPAQRPQQFTWPWQSPLLAQWFLVNPSRRSPFQRHQLNRSFQFPPPRAL